MYAVIQTGGKQYRVSPGELIKIEKVSGAVGDEVHFDQVLFVGEDEESTLRPTRDGVMVKGTIVDQSRGDKIIVFKFKRRKMYRRRTGHRQHLTSVRIEEIGPASRPDEAPKADAEKKQASKAKAAPAKAPKAKPAAPKAPKAKPAAKKAAPAKAESAKPVTKSKAAAAEKESEPKSAQAAPKKAKKAATKKPAKKSSSEKPSQEKE